jgi:outer membrane lipoprotein-sorting protein
MNDKLARSGWIPKCLLSAAMLFMLIAPMGNRATAGETESISEMLSRLDQAAHSFTGATAQIRVVTHTAIINEDETQTGTVVLKRSSSARLAFLINFTGPDAQAIALRDNQLQIYYPKLNSVREYDLGKYKDIVQKLILLGFGMSGRELRASYDVGKLGDERIESQDTMHIQLTPKNPEILQQLSRVDLWISLTNNCPVQQKFYMPGGDYRLVMYSNITVNPHLPLSALDLPKGAKRERMN